MNESRICHNGSLPGQTAKMTLKFHDGTADKYKMRKEKLTRGTVMIQWMGVLIAVLGLAYNGFKDYQKGDIKIPQLTKPVYPIQYCLMAYDPNLDKVFYQHENGQWYDYAPQQRRYSSPQEHHQNQGQKALASVNGTQGVSGNYIR